jgi:hypothetical protein
MSGTWRRGRLRLVLLLLLLLLLFLFRSRNRPDSLGCYQRINWLGLGRLFLFLQRVRQKRRR